MSKIEFRKTFSFSYYLWLIGVLVLAFLVWSIFQKTRIEWPITFYLVQSGSMEPSIMTGDLILVKKNATYLLNDVVTFKDDEQRTVTHRIIEKLQGGSEPRFATKGDANQAADRLEVGQNQIIGKVELVLPKLGFLAAFGKSRGGIILLVVVPTVLIIYDEFRRWRRK